MRYIPSLCLRSGMIIGKDVIGSNGQLLLTIGTVLNEKYIDSIVKKGFSGVYIDDGISENIEVTTVINDDLRQRTIRGLKDIFISIEKESKEKYKKMDWLRLEISNIIEEILNDKNLIVNMVDLKFFDDYTYQHSVNVAVLSIIMGVALNLSTEKLFSLGLAALLHDIGKVFIYKNVLNKPGKLDVEELEEMKNHVIYGYEYLKSEFDFSVPVFVGVLDHHEKYDGTGYPNKKAADRISLFGRIIAIADVYDAITSERPYRTAMVPSEAMEFMMGGCGTHFDHELINVFIRKVAAYPLGTIVELSNGYIGIVTKNFNDACLRPEIRVYKVNDEEVSPFIVNLRDDKNYLNVIIKSINDE